MVIQCIYKFSTQYNYCVIINPLYLSKMASILDKPPKPKNTPMFIYNGAHSKYIKHPTFVFSHMYMLYTRGIMEYL